MPFEVSDVTRVLRRRDAHLLLSIADQMVIENDDRKALRASPAMIAQRQHGKDERARQKFERRPRELRAPAWTGRSNAALDRMDLVRLPPLVDLSAGGLRPFDHLSRVLLPKHVDDQADAECGALQLDALERVEGLNRKRSFGQHRAGIDVLDHTMDGDGLRRAAVAQFPQPWGAAAAIIGDLVFVDVDRSPAGDREERRLQNSCGVDETVVRIEGSDELQAVGSVDVAGQVKPYAARFP